MHRLRKIASAPTLHAGFNMDIEVDAIRERAFRVLLSRLASTLLEVT
jgi:hypothetical protein